MAKKKNECPPKTPCTVEQLRRCLVRAIELEHILMSAYLFTAYTLKQDASEGGFSEDPNQRQIELQAAISWRGAITGVAVQEMLHMALGGNMLAAIGGDPKFSRRGLDFPISPRTMKRRFGYDGRAWLGLWPFSELTIQRFIWYEAFEHEEFPGPPYDAALPVHSEPIFLESLEDMEISSLVELYEAIARGFVFLNNKLGPEKLFPPERRLFQVTDQEVTGLFNFPPAQGPDGSFRPLLVPVTDVHSALIAINTIIMQGEGDSDAWEAFIETLDTDPKNKVFAKILSPSHHDTFLQILLGRPAICGTDPKTVHPAMPGYYELRLANSDFQPARQVPQNPLVENPCKGRRDDKACRRHVHLIRNRFTKQVATLFNDLYETVINLLALGYAQVGARHVETVNEYAKATLIQSSIRAMVYLVAPLGNVLPQLPGDRKETWFAGPGFVFENRHGDWDAMADRLPHPAHVFVADEA